MTKNAAAEVHAGTAPTRFFDSRASYLMFTTATTEKPVVAARIGEQDPSATKHTWPALSTPLRRPTSGASGLIGGDAKEAREFPTPFH